MSPRLKYDVIPISQVPKEDDITTPARPMVLIVDDEKVIADTLSIILSKSGFSTLTAYDGASALEIARERSPNLLISDVMMPGMTGIDLAIKVTQTIPGCKVLLFSGQAATIDLLEKARLDGHNFTTLTKPVHPTDMLKRISECLASPEPIPRSMPLSAANRPQPRHRSSPNSRSLALAQGPGVSPLEINDGGNLQVLS